MNKIIFLLGLVFLGCVGSIGGTNLIDTTYYHTEQLLNKENILYPGDRVVLASIVDINNLDNTTQFGRTITEEVAKEFIDRGYQVIDVRASLRGVVVKRRKGEFYITRDVENLARAVRANAIFYGTYSVGKNYVYVNLKLINPKTHVVLNSIDYRIPLTDDIKKMLGIKEKIRYVKESW